MSKQRSTIKETWWKHLLAGSLAGIVSRSLTAPLDRLKVFAQVTGTYRRPVKLLREMIRNEGTLSLWRGNGINMIKITPETSSKFFVYEYSKLLMGAEQRTLSIPERFVAAALSGVVSQTIIFPIEVVKTRMVIRQGKNKRYALRDVWHNLLKHRGYKGLFKGYISSAGGIILFAGTDLCTYETIKLFVRDHIVNTGSNVRYPVILSCAVCACLAGQIVSYPLSMASTTVQASDDHKKARHIIIERYKKNGIYGWYRGSSMAFMKAVPAVCITYMVYECVLNKLGAHMTL